MMLLSILLLGGLQDARTEQIEEFKRFYRANRSRAEKVEAIHVLEDCDRAEAAELLLETCKDKDFAVRTAAIEVLSVFGSGPVTELLITYATNPKRSKDGTRSAAIEALGKMHKTVAADALMENLGDRDFEIRRATVEALGRLQWSAAIEPLVGLLGDKERALRTAALEALARIGKPEGCLAAVTSMLEDDDWQVRSAAIAGLSRFRQKDSVQPLIDCLAREGGRLRDDTRDALENITSFTYPAEAQQWQRWWDGIKDRFQVPTDAELARMRAAQAAAEAKYKSPDNSFLGIPTRSKSIIFVVDISGSMEELVTEKTTIKGTGRSYRSVQKIDIVKEELATTIEGLEKGTRFNVLPFATEVKPWKKSLVAANVVNVSGAEKFIRGLKPIGGASQSFRARAGLSTAAKEGKTNTYAALMAALNAGNPKGGYDKNYSTKVDTIYFLSDGIPSTGEYMDAAEILSELRRVNSLRNVVIHTIAIGEMDHHLMRQIAAQNDGKFVDLGK